MEKPLGFYNIKKYYVKNNEQITCRLCPQECKIVDGSKGLCKMRINIGGRFFSTVYGRPASIHIDPIEKKPLYHYLPGEKILSLGTLGCNLFCKGCQNHDISRSEVILDQGYYSPEDIVKAALDAKVNMIAYTYNEPTIFFEYMIDIAKIAKKNGIKNIIVSNGYINKAPLQELMKYIDAANIDLKGFDVGFYKGYAAAKLDKVLDTLKSIAYHNKHSKHKVWLEITTLIIPGLNDDMGDIRKMCLWIKKNLGSETPLHFSRFFPDYKVSDVSATSQETLLRAKSVALDTGLKYVYIGNIGAIEDTKCVECNNILISRGYGVEIKGLTGKKNNVCSVCRKILEGVFI